MLDIEFLSSLGITEELRRPYPEPKTVEAGPNFPPVLPTAGPRGIPTELLSLKEAELEKLLKEEHNPYMYRMPNGIHRVAVYPDKTLGRYDLEYTANQFIFLVGLARDPDIEGMIAYKPRHGQWHSVDSNPSQEVEDLLLLLDADDRNTVTQSKRRQQHDIHDDYGVE